MEVGGSDKTTSYGYQHWVPYFTPVGTYTTLANHVHVIRYVLHNIKVYTLTSGDKPCKKYAGEEKMFFCDNAGSGVKILICRIQIQLKMDWIRNPGQKSFKC
jgi:hypothetical protein